MGTLEWRLCFQSSAGLSPETAYGVGSQVVLLDRHWSLITLQFGDPKGCFVLKFSLGISLVGTLQWPVLYDKSLSPLPAMSLEINVEVTMIAQLLHSTHQLSQHCSDTTKFYSSHLLHGGFLFIWAMFAPWLGQQRGAALGLEAVEGSECWEPVGTTLEIFPSRTCSDTVIWEAALEGSSKWLQSLALIVLMVPSTMAFCFFN